MGADGEDIGTMSELTAAKAGKSAGDTMTLTPAGYDGNSDVTITLTGDEPSEEQ